MIWTNWRAGIVGAAGSTDSTQNPVRIQRGCVRGFGFLATNALCQKIAKTSVLLTTQADQNAVICKGYPFDPNGALARRATRLASNRRRIRDGI